ncbi:MAG TPA: CBS domain-containing protein, partial [Candidatus Thermoplasmatota archaeon]|nr:CBS domain-containing protein [Candidatus Thermoplasmatota archaeon]
GDRREALRLLAKHGAAALPVVKAGTRQLAGLVTRNDVVAKPQEEQLALVMARDPLVLAPDADVAEAARAFHRHRLHAIPVVEAGLLVGLVTPADVLRAAGGRGGSVDGLATTRVVPVHQDTPLKVAWRALRLTGQEALPVMDDDARLVGIVAESDLFRTSGVAEGVAKHDVGMTEGDLDEESFRDVATFYYAQSEVAFPRRPVKDVMVRKVVTVFEKTSAEDAARKMVKANVNQLPVVDAGDQLVGMVTDLDLLRAWFP